MSNTYAERLAEAGIEPSAGGVGDKDEVIHRRRLQRCFEAVEYATPEGGNWFNYRRLIQPIGNVHPAEAEE